MVFSYLNNERKIFENFISVCVFENLFLMSVKIHCCSSLPWMAQPPQSLCDN